MAIGSGQRRLEVVIAGDASGASRAFREVAGDADRAGGALGRVGGVASMAGRGIGLVGAAAAAAVVGVGYFAVKLGKDAVQAATEAAKVTAQTEAAITSSGGAAGRTADQIGALAEELSYMSGVEDEAVQAGQNMLLTFHNIQGVNFDDATRTMLDMSVALGQDATQSAMQLGKALNDPIRGITALRRVGVQFTKAQEDQIKAMVEAGDVAGAQRVILAELNKEFGGSAKAAGDAAGGWRRLALVWGNLQEEIGKGIREAFGPLGDALADTAAKIKMSLQPAFEALMPILRAVGERITNVVRPALEGLGAMADEIGPRFERIAPEIEAAVKRGDWGAVKATFKRLVDDSFATAAPNLAGVFNLQDGSWEEKKAELGQKIKDVVLAALDGLGSAGGEIAEKTGRIIGSILVSPALWAGIAKGAWGVFQGAFGGEGVVGAIKIGAIILAALATAVGLAIAGIPATVALLAASLVALLSGFIMEGVAKITETLANWIAGVVQFLFEGAIRLGEAFGRGLITWLPRVVEFFARIGEEIIGAVARFTQWLFEGAIRAGERFVQGFRDKWPAIRQWFVDLPGNIMGALGDVGRWLLDAGRQVVEGMWRGISAAGSWLWRQVQDFFRRNVIDPAKRALGIASPSDVFAQFGREIDRGLAQGMYADIQKVQAAALALRDAAAAGMTPQEQLRAGMGLVRQVTGLAGQATSMAGVSNRGMAPINLNAQVVGGREQVMAWLQEGLREYERRNGRKAI